MLSSNVRDLASINHEYLTFEVDLRTRAHSFPTGSYPQQKKKNISFSEMKK